MADKRRVDYICPDCGDVEYMYEYIIYGYSRSDKEYEEKNVNGHKAMRLKACRVCGHKGLNALFLYGESAG